MRVTLTVLDLTVCDLSITEDQAEADEPEPPLFGFGTSSSPSMEIAPLFVEPGTEGTE